MKTKRTAAVIVLVALALLAGTGCRRVRVADVEPTAAEGRVEREVELAGAERAKVALKMGAGEMSVRSKPGSDTLMTATFKARPERWLPEVRYDVAAGVGRLDVTQPSIGSPTFDPDWFDDNTNEWDVRLAEGVPMDLAIDLGAGESTLRLGGLRLADLTVATGAGETTIDLSGEWAEDLAAQISGGVGQVTLIVPRDVGVRVRSQSGIGAVSAEDFRIEGGAYVNDALGDTPVTLDVELQQGIGDVELVLAD